MYTVFEEARGDRFETHFETLTEAREFAQMVLNHLTPHEKETQRIYIGAETEFGIDVYDYVLPH